MKSLALTLTTLSLLLSLTAASPVAAPRQPTPIINEDPLPTHPQPTIKPRDPAPFSLRFPDHFSRITFAPFTPVDPNRPMTSGPPTPTFTFHTLPTFNPPLTFKIPTFTVPPDTIETPPPFGEIPQSPGRPGDRRRNAEPEPEPEAEAEAEPMPPRWCGWVFDDDGTGKPHRHLECDEHGGGEGVDGFPNIGTHFSYPPPPK